jgi:hypothetical protein
MTRICSKKIYEQTGTKATEIHSLFQKKLRTNRNQSLYFLWNNIEIMVFVTIMSTKWIQFKVFNFQQFDDLIKHSRENHPYHCYYCKTATFVLFEEAIKHSTENHGSLMLKVKYLANKQEPKPLFSLE